VLIRPQLLSSVFLPGMQGVLHVGAHKAEERADYIEVGWNRIIWVEAQSSLAEALRTQIDCDSEMVFHCAAWGKSNLELTLNIASNSQSTSLFDFEMHSHYYPEVVASGAEKVLTRRLDELVPEDFPLDFINLDIQGAELEALKGLGHLLEKVQAVYVEVNRELLYAGIPMVSDIDRFLERWGFARAVTVWTHAGWGDALFLKRNGQISRECRIQIGQLIFFVADRVQRAKRILKKSMTQIYRKFGRRGAHR